MFGADAGLDRDRGGPAGSAHGRGHDAARAGSDEDGNPHRAGRDCEIAAEHVKQVDRVAAKELLMEQKAQD